MAFRIHASKFMIYQHKQHEKHHEFTDIFYREESYHSGKLKWWEAPESKIFLETIIAISEINYVMRYPLMGNGEEVYILEKMIYGSKIAVAYLSLSYAVNLKSIGLSEYTIENKMINVPSGIFLTQIL